MSSKNYYVTDGVTRINVSKKRYEEMAIEHQVLKLEIPEATKREFAKKAEELKKGFTGDLDISAYDLRCNFTLLVNDIFSEDGDYIKVNTCQSISGNKILNKLFKDMCLASDITNISTDFGQLLFNKIYDCKQAKIFRKKIYSFIKDVEKAGLTQGDY